MEQVNKRFKISKWIMLSLAILFNGFIIVYSCLSDKVTNEWSRFVSNIFTNIVNSVTQKEPDIIPIKDIDPIIHPEYPYHQLPGYEIDEIPLGYSKEIRTTINPDTATNPALTYTTEQNDIVYINSFANDSAFVTGLKVGDAIIKVSNSDNSVSKEVKVKVVDNIAPLEFYASLDNKNIALGNPEGIDFSYHNPNFSPENTDKTRRYSLAYDLTKLTYESSNADVATVDKYGVIHPISEGTSTISVSGNKNDKGKVYSYKFDITVVPGVEPTPYTGLEIGGISDCYENELFEDNPLANDLYQKLTIKDSNGDLDPKDFIWEASKNFNVKIDNHGLMRGNLKPLKADATLTIKATSKKTGQVVSKEVTIKKQLPTVIYTCFMMGEKEMWSPNKLTAFVGDVVTARVMYDIDSSNLNIDVKASDNEMVNIVNKGDSVVLEFKKEGTVDITITSELVPTLSKTTTFTITKAGAITKDDYEDLNLTIRKSIGHAMMFGVTQIFTFLAIYMFFYEKKWYWLALISLGCGIALASISELIQFFIPLRSGTFIDVLIDLSGVAIGLALVVGILLLIKRFKKLNK